MEKKNYKIIHDIDDIKINSVDSIISDVRNDSEMAMSKETWKKAYRVIKPGAYMLILSGNKLSHRICCAIEDGGFEIKDSIMWIYKSNVLTLQPDYCNIVVARKPTELSILDNIDLYGVGGINIDACRVGSESRTIPINSNDIKSDDSIFTELHKNIQRERVATNQGRFPANVILTYGDDDKDLVCGGFPISGQSNSTGQPYNYSGRVYDNASTSMFNGDKPQAPSNYNDVGSASRYFYNAERSRKDGDYNLPVNLIQYLVKLVNPKSSSILDLCMGSGEVGKAVLYENKENNSDYTYIGMTKSNYPTLDTENIFEYINSIKIKQDIIKMEESKAEQKLERKLKQTKLF